MRRDGSKGGGVRGRVGGRYRKEYRARYDDLGLLGIDFRSCAAQDTHETYDLTSALSPKQNDPRNDRHQDTCTRSEQGSGGCGMGNREGVPGDLQL